MEIKVMME